MITENIATLVNYGIAAGLVDEADRIYTTNRLLELFELEEYDEPAGEAVNDPSTFDLEKLLGEMLDYALEILHGNANKLLGITLPQHGTLA